MLVQVPHVTALDARPDAALEQAVGAGLTLHDQCPTIGAQRLGREDRRRSCTYSDARPFAGTVSGKVV